MVELSSLCPDFLSVLRYHAAFSLTTKRLYDVSSTCVLSHAMQLLLQQLQNVLWPKPTKRELPMVHFSIYTSHPSEVTS